MYERWRVAAGCGIQREDWVEMVGAGVNGRFTCAPVVIIIIMKMEHEDYGLYTVYRIPEQGIVNV